DHLLLGVPEQLVDPAVQVQQLCGAVEAPHHRLEGILVARLRSGLGLDDRTGRFHCVVVSCVPVPPSGTAGPNESITMRPGTSVPPYSVRAHGTSTVPPDFSAPFRPRGRAGDRGARPAPRTAPQRPLRSRRPVAAPRAQAPGPDLRASRHPSPW